MVQPKKGKIKRKCPKTLLPKLKPWGSTKPKNQPSHINLTIPGTSIPQNPLHQLVCSILSFASQWKSCFLLHLVIKYKNFCIKGFLAIDCSDWGNYSCRNYLGPSMLGTPRQILSCSKYSQRFCSSESYSVLNSAGLQHWFKNWQGLRRQKLTASTFAAAMGFSNYRRVGLWLEKIGAVEPFSGNLATCWNNIKEEEALERYKLITGNSVSFPEFQVYGNVNPGDDWLAASPDGVVDQMVYGLPLRGVLEIKCPFFDGDMSKAFPWTRVPLYCIPQAQGLMEIVDREWMDLYVWTPNGSSLFRLYRDAAYWDMMKYALSDFWWNHVQPARELYSKSHAMNPLIESYRPKPKPEHWKYIIYESKRIVESSDLLWREIHGKLQN